jgi:V/A-type H+-transporting ATPase subunit F
MNTTGLFVIGDEHTVCGFGLLGIAGRAVSVADGARAALDQVLADRTVLIVLITDVLAAALRGELDRLRSELPMPLIVEIPGSTQQGEHPTIRARLQQALGVHVEGTIHAGDYRQSG